ncbi:TPA: type 1 fimbrial protein [Serratia marcescens]|uniref:Type 1 fimbrial protein n=1 Tax=Serratia ureilytica TaxID=300181 RepID=A0A9X9BZA2_9GAMM|nr:MULTISPECIES: type 1 fimbrial protein [Serratia]TXE22532.1 type 1 fimbrial protein [Serratia ureilytica]HBC7422438.1 type 1 fimbrial protein [Serratia marcescens]
MLNPVPVWPGNAQQYLCLGLAGVLSYFTVNGCWAADSQTITFNITVPAVTCTVTPQNVTVSADIDGTAFVNKAWQTGGEQNLNVGLSCQGNGAAGKLPKLTIAPAASTSVLAGSSDFLFRDSTSTSKGFGVAIFNKAAGSITKNATTDMVKNGDTAWTGPTGASGADLTQTITLSTGIACGPQANCTPSKLEPGNLKASVIFNFAYN